MTQSGLVPISPNTTPSAASDNFTSCLLFKSFGPPFSSVFSGFNFDEFVKSQISPPLAGGGYNRLKYHLIHPQPGPLPSTEREIFDFLRDRQL
jgi:hypothetical protein